MSRRAFLSQSVGWAGASVVPALAQTSRLRKIGFLMPDANSARRWLALTEGLRALGWEDGRNLEVVTRQAQGKLEPVQALTSELMQAGVELIVSYGTPVLAEIMKINRAIPIVGATMVEPVIGGLASSLRRPGRNLTGVSIVYDGIVTKTLELVRISNPKARRVATLSRPPGTAAVIHLKWLDELRTVMDAAKLKHVAVHADTVAEIDQALARLNRDKVDALIVLISPFYVSQRERLAQGGLKLKLPVFTQSEEFVEAGCLVSYGADAIDACRRSAAHVDKILKGAKPGDLPIEQSSKLELVINRRTADAIGFRLAPELLLRADRIIE